MAMIDIVDIDEEVVLAEVQKQLRKGKANTAFPNTAAPKGAMVNVGGGGPTASSATVQGSSKKCRCGSSSHLRTTHKDCPVRKKKTV